MLNSNMSELRIELENAIKISVFMIIVSINPNKSFLR
ncbi:Uncharacterised protein [Salmonella enterica subsp. enterica serovar Sanjuan]|uniref:Uncharacterized protein n=1 Tax=Salmonella enterica subsp. enterica serovar Sanjuan TaxID=1160765 RepID=A0A3S4IYX2_SALET|nr:Uncharacterised protein [Salmonella enterica subsp. enterica serovar Sanjuan]